MTIFDVTYCAEVPDGTDAILIPGGLATPHGTIVEIACDQAPVNFVKEATTGQKVGIVSAPSARVTLHLRCDGKQTAPYPDKMFNPVPSRFTRAADDLVAQARAAAGDLTGVARARAIACHTAALFAYAHPDAHFNDGRDVVPALGCGLTEGSCVDINTYFIAAMRAAGIEAGYVTGFFFPAEKRGLCSDGHCWVATRIGGETQEWDIAHHLKIGTREIEPALNPRRGHRVACFHSMGLDIPECGVTALKALIEPVCVRQGVVLRFEAPTIHLGSGVSA